MNLKLIANNPYPQFAVYDQDKLVVRVKIDKEMKALRIACNESRRVFFIVEEKLRKVNVCVLVNEYSQQMGTLIKDKSEQSSGEIDLEGMRLRYTITSYPVKEIILFENNKPEPIINCRINDALLLEYGDYIDYFIFSLSWFAFLSKQKTKVMQYEGA